jgi:2-polyprenyl-3-methyl-5-hydroxy-6-metoxy-1,4-benzoquinol methylase
MTSTYITEWTQGAIDIQDCYWYHGYDFTKHVPGIEPDYYLEDSLEHFLLPPDMTGRTFLDVGTASGYLSFTMEKRGAEVVSFDLSPEEAPDQIPYWNADDRSQYNEEHWAQLRRSYWYAHRHFDSRAKAVYGNILNMPEGLGTFDVAMIGSVLQHVRDPFLAIQQVDAHTKDTLIICEAHFPSKDPVIVFQAEPEASQPQFWTWWRMSSAFLVQAMKVLGYRDVVVTKPFDLDHVRCGFKVSSVTVKGRKG